MARTVEAFLFRSGQFLHFCPESQEEKMRKEDRRVRRTRESLHDALISLALEKNYDSITVQEILDRADVGRSTFYVHFSDKNELLISEMDNLREELSAAIERQRGTGERHEVI